MTRLIPRRPARPARILRRAVIASHGGHSDLALGVFDVSGTFAPLSQARLSRNRMSGVPEHARPSKPRKGTDFCAGFGHPPFGRFPIRAVVRLWACDTVPEPIGEPVLAARQSMADALSLARIDPRQRPACH